MNRTSKSITRSTQVICVFFLMTVTVTARAVTIAVPNITSPPANQTVSVPITVSGGQENLMGLELAFEVVDPTDRVTLRSMNLKPASGLFTPFSTFVGPTEIFFPVRPLEFREGFRQLVIHFDETTDPPRQVYAQVDGVDKLLAIVTLQLTDPAPGVYGLRISQTTSGHRTRLGDDSLDDGVLDDLQLVNGSITIVPEPATASMAFVFSGLAFVNARRWARRRAISRT